MKVKVKLPELAHLTPEQREPIIRRCLRSDDLRHYRSRALRRLLVGGFVFAVLLILSLFTVNEHAPWLPVLLVAGYLLFGVAMTVLKIRGEVRLFHRLVQRELEAYPRPPES